MGQQRPIFDGRAMSAITPRGNRPARYRQLRVWGAALQADGETRSRFRGLKHQKEKRSMDHFAGLDVSVKDTSVCIVDDTSKFRREGRARERPRHRDGG